MALRSFRREELETHFRVWNSGLVFVASVNLKYDFLSVRVKVF